MATDQLGEAVRLLRRSDEKTLSDGDLLERFIARRDEATFAALVCRHGPMVYGVQYDNAREFLKKAPKYAGHRQPEARR